MFSRYTCGGDLDAYINAMMTMVKELANRAREMERVERKWISKIIFFCVFLASILKVSILVSSWKI